MAYAIAYSPQSVPPSCKVVLAIKIVMLSSVVCIIDATCIVVHFDKVLYVLSYTFTVF